MKVGISQSWMNILISNSFVNDPPCPWLPAGGSVPGCDSTPAGDPTPAWAKLSRAIYLRAGSITGKSHNSFWEPNL